jgi:RNA polymerase sigma-70 factor (ECF subfamily)
MTTRLHEPPAPLRPVTEEHRDAGHPRRALVPAPRPAPGALPPAPRTSPDRTAPPSCAEDLIREVIAEHGTAMRCYAHQLTGDRARAEDVVQEALLRTWQNSGALVNGRGSVRGWLLTVVRNLVTDGARARRARPTEVGGDVPVAPVQRDHADRVSATVTVESALPHLSQPHRDVLEQVYLAERSVEETAEILQIPAGTVKSRCHYGLRALREIVEPSAARRRGAGDDERRPPR